MEVYKVQVISHIEEKKEILITLHLSSVLSDAFAFNIASSMNY